jgi:hypothetical protein
MTLLLITTSISVIPGALSPGRNHLYKPLLTGYISGEYQLLAHNPSRLRFADIRLRIDLGHQSISILN